MALESLLHTVKTWAMTNGKKQTKLRNMCGCRTTWLRARGSASSGALVAPRNPNEPEPPGIVAFTLAGVADEVGAKAISNGAPEPIATTSELVEWY